MNLGRCAVLDTGRVEMVVSEDRHEPFDTGCFTHAGIDPARKRYVLIKSRQPTTYCTFAYADRPRYLGIGRPPVRLEDADYLQVKFIHLLVDSARKPPSLRRCKFEVNVSRTILFVMASVVNYSAGFYRCYPLIWRRIRRP